MTSLLTAQLCLLAGCCVGSWASSPRMPTPGIMPDSIGGAQATLTFADGSCCSDLARMLICCKEE